MMKNQILAFIVGVLFSVSAFPSDFSEIVKRLFDKGINDSKTYQEARRTLREYGVEKFRDDMTKNGVFSQEGKILPAIQPFNAFARILSGDLKPAYPLDMLEKKGFYEAAQKYLLAANKPELDAEWENPEHAGRASMSLHHRFLIPRTHRWSTFNALTLGMDPDFNLEQAIELLNDMENVALAYANAEGWGENVGLFFHCYPFNSVHTLHLHIIDLNHTGPSFEAQRHKNLSLDEVRRALRTEQLSNQHQNNQTQPGEAGQQMMNTKPLSGFGSSSH